MTFLERSFEYYGVRTATAVELAKLSSAAPAADGASALPVPAALSGVLPHGLRRGTAVGVTGSVSLLLALLGALSADGAWCALVGLPTVGAEAAVEYGVRLSRLAVIPSPGAQWERAVGALLDGFDVVAVRPRGRVPPGEAQRLAARTRSQGAVLIPFGDVAWPGVEVRLDVADARWDGIGDGFGRLRARRLTVTAQGRGRAARPRSAALWLPAAGGGASQASGVSAPATVVPLSRAGGSRAGWPVAGGPAVKSPVAGASRAGGSAAGASRADGSAAGGPVRWP